MTVSVDVKRSLDECPKSCSYWKAVIQHVMSPTLFESSLIQFESEHVRCSKVTPRHLKPGTMWISELLRLNCTWETLFRVQGLNKTAFGLVALIFRRIYICSGR